MNRPPAGGDPAERSAPDTRDLGATVMWCWRLVRKESAPLFFGLIVVTIVRGLTPAAAALVVRGLINVVIRPGAGIGATVPWLVAGFLVAAVEAVTRFANTYLARRLSDDLDVRVTTDLMHHAYGLDLAFFENSENRDLIQRTQQNTGQRLTKLVSESQSAVSNVLQAVSLLGILVTIEPLVLLAVPPFAIPFLIFQWRLARRSFLEEHLRATKRRWSRYYMSLITGPYSVAEVRLLDLGPLLLSRFRKLVTEFRDRNRLLYRRNFTGSSIAAILTLAVLYVLFARVALRALDGSATVGDLAIFGGATAALRTALDNAIRSVSGSLEQTLFVTNLKRFHATTPELRSGSRSVTDMVGASISVRDVSFTYPGSTQPVVSNVSFDIKSGETLAIVGENGAGKSTLAKLIARLYDPDSGTILFGGVDLRELKLEELHRKIGFLFQTFGRYEATAADNIAFGDWRTMLDDRERIVAAARAAKVDGLVENLPGKYDTVLGREFGDVTLSGGEWQQLAMARANARETSLLILDEPTSSLDARAEYEVFSRFKRLASGRTTILISHRFTTIGMADRIIVLADGAIAEVGSHEELLLKSGTYAALYSLHERSLPWTSE